jgi:2,4'-dihydroxyacetophenone dioxygenase
MSETEFWRDLKPIDTVFRDGALPEAYVQDAPTDDERYYEAVGIGAGYVDALMR